MRLSGIVAMSENRVIGIHNKLPWHLPADLKHFKDLTMDKPIIMGRHTHLSIGRPLPGRCNIVITRDPDFHAPGCVVAHSLGSAVEAAAYSDEVFIIGGEKLFESMLPRLQRLYLTIVHENIVGDAYFPEMDMSEWKEVERQDFEADVLNPLSYSFITLDRVK